MNQFIQINQIMHDGLINNPKMPDPAPAKLLHFQDLQMLQMYS